ncbi:MAG: cytochrome c [Candidatus Sericytochromatia bacterium]|nr:cytochrome c [Candidatus Sericytochromatia bacterium]
MGGFAASRFKIVALLACAFLFSLGCREPLQFDRVNLADAERGARLFRGNCAKSCHPAHACEQPQLTSYEELAYTVRDYYEGAMGGEDNYSQQDIFDITRYLNDKYYKFQHRTEP